MKDNKLICGTGWVASRLPTASAGRGALKAWLVAGVVGVAGMGGFASAVYAQAAQSTQTAVAAPDAPAQAAVARSEVGHATLAWLDLQRNNTEAAPAQPMLGDEAGLAYKRYMESFNSKIPAQSASALSQGSGSSGQLPN